MAVKNVCQCDDPPGGEIRCEPHQMAVCGILNGLAYRECCDPPGPTGGHIISDPDRKNHMLVIWAIETVKGAPLDSSYIVSEHDLKMLQSGYYSATFTHVRFTLPPGVKNAVENMLRPGGSYNDVGRTQ